MRIAVMLDEDSGKTEAYLQAVRSIEGEPVINPESLDGIEGLLLTGGTDVDPRLYNEAPHVETQPPNPARDAREVVILQAALQADLPVLAICRGMQLFNVVHNGTLMQHLEGGSHANKEVADAHSITIEADSLLAEIVGCSEMTVNSRHHQAAGRVGAGLRVSASSPDGVIEALENAACGFALAVQWHPEDRVETHEADKRIFQAFARAIRENRR